MKKAAKTYDSTKPMTGFQTKTNGEYRTPYVLSWHEDDSRDIQPSLLMPRMESHVRLGQ